MMRTTIRMNEKLAARVKAYAHRTNQTFTSAVEEALESMLHHRLPKNPRTLPKLPVIHGKTRLTQVQLDRAVEDIDLEDDIRRLGIKS